MLNVHAQTWMIYQQKPFGDYLNSVDHIIT